MRSAVRRNGARRAAAQPAGGVGVSPTTCWAGGEGVSPTTSRAGGWEELHPPDNRVTQWTPSAEETAREPSFPRKREPRYRRPSHHQRPPQQVSGEPADPWTGLNAGGSAEGRRPSAGGMGVSPTTSRVGGWEELHPPDNRGLRSGPVCGGDREGAVIPAKAGTQVSTPPPTINAHPNRVSGEPADSWPALGTGERRGTPPNLPGCGGVPHNITGGWVGKYYVRRKME